MTPTRKLVIAAVIGAAGIWATCALGFWQLRRAAGKEALQAQVETAALATPVVPDGDALRDAASLVHRHVALRGRWLPDSAVYLDNRPHDGQAGFYVLMPLRLDRPIGADVIVNRGWLPRNRNDRTRIESYRTPDGIVDVTGVVAADEQRFLDLGTQPEHVLKGIWQNFDFDAYEKASGSKPLPIIIREDASSNDDALARDWPDRGGALQSQIDRHHGYAFQWFAMAATLGALLFYQFLRVIRHGRTVPQTR